jgi:hypothetical protein
MASIMSQNRPALSFKETNPDHAEPSGHGQRDNARAPPCVQASSAGVDTSVREPRAPTTTRGRSGIGSLAIYWFLETVAGLW